MLWLLGVLGCSVAALGWAGGPAGACFLVGCLAFAGLSSLGTQLAVLMFDARVVPRCGCGFTGERCGRRVVAVMEGLLG